MKKHRNIFLITAAVSGTLIGCNSGGTALSTNSTSPSGLANEWVSGSDTVNQIGVYGIQGVSAINNIPGAREGSVSFTDSSNNLWLFSGNGYDSTGAVGHLNDLWKYDKGNNQWTWVSGSDVVDQVGNYGIQGVTARTNIPGARDSATSWSSDDGTLWVFGGHGFDADGVHGDLNDLWKYDSSSGQWTWMRGSRTANQHGFYGTLGVPSNTNTPGAREGAAGGRTNDGKIWLFGGNGYDSTGAIGHLNDLWEYDPSTNQWVWLSGSDVIDQVGNYGIQGVTASTNIPGARDGANGWSNDDGTLWLFGGHGFDAAGTHGDLNDLWKYDPSSGQWTWMRGSRTANQHGFYGTLGVASNTTTPGAREGAVTAWSEGGNLFLFSGNGYDAAGTNGHLNDLWQYNISSNQWKWINGSDLIDQSGIYGTLGVPAIGNIPGARDGAISWSSGSSMWVFSGHGFDVNGVHDDLNDLWKLELE